MLSISSRTSKMFRNIICAGKVQRSGALISNISFVCNISTDYFIGI